jgi:nucleoside-diphosphate-sugar epimerase
MENILITGASGFLGGSVAARFIEIGQASSLLLLIRCQTPAEGLERVRQSLRTLEIPEAQISQLTEDQILPGDFLDVEAFSGDPRLDRVTRVINCAAIASFGTNPLIWPVNVDGTFAFARRMAKAPRLRRFLHVGTAMACGPLMTSPVRESWELAPSGEHLVAYTASKAAIEAKLRTELPELPLVVARPSIVVGHTKLGCKPSGSIFWVFRMARAGTIHLRPGREDRCYPGGLLRRSSGHAGFEAASGA